MVWNTKTHGLISHIAESSISTGFARPSRDALNAITRLRKVATGKVSYDYNPLTGQVRSLSADGNGLSLMTDRSTSASLSATISLSRILSLPCSTRTSAWWMARL